MTEVAPSKNPEFKEGPFFLFTSTVYPYIGKQAVIWATDETTARNVFAFKLNLPTTYCTTVLLGNLEALKNTLRLSYAQLRDLHQDGYVKLGKETK